MLVTLTFVAYIYSQPVEGRYISTFKALTGQIDTRYDSSGGARMARAKIAMASIASHPLGTGWGSQGWVHSDILQISATIGIIPGVIFLFALLSLLLRSYRCYLTAIPEQKTLFFVLCGFLIYIIISLSLNGNIFLVQSGVPLFLFWALAFSYSEHYNNIGRGYSL
jgi:O-antigen ligase